MRTRVPSLGPGWTSYRARPPSSSTPTALHNSLVLAQPAPGQQHCSARVWVLQGKFTSSRGCSAAAAVKLSKYPGQMWMCRISCPHGLPWHWGATNNSRKGQRRLRTLPARRHLARTPCSTSGDFSVKTNQVFLVL